MDDPEPDRRHDQAIPVVYTVGLFVWRRRLDPTGVAIVCFGAGFLLVLVTGGNELVFKIREDIWTGPLGLARRRGGAAARAAAPRVRCSGAPGG